MPHFFGINTILHCDSATLLAQAEFPRMVSPIEYAPICLSWKEVRVHVATKSEFPRVVRPIEYAPICLSLEEVRVHAE
jgi:hypothetical protein